MMDTTHPLITDYLDRLRRAAVGLPETDARELAADIEEHFRAATDGRAISEAEVRTLIDRLGPPEDLVAAAAPPTTAPTTEPAAQPRREWEATTVAMLLAAEVLILTILLIPIGLVVWVIGLVFLARCHRWTSSQRLRAGLVLGSGVPVALLALVASGMATFRSVSQACSVDAAGVEHCTGAASSGPAAWVPWLLAALGIGYAALQIVTARRLLAAVGEHGPRPKGLRLR